MHIVTLSRMVYAYLCYSSLSKSCSTYPLGFISTFLSLADITVLIDLVVAMYPLVFLAYYNSFFCVVEDANTGMNNSMG